MLKPHDIKVTNNLMHFVGHWLKKKEKKSDKTALMFYDLWEAANRIRSAKNAGREPSEKVTPSVRRLN